ncbi:MAG: Asp-tRNA(Asn)/Glu-tRNA(Gln) amidotransferase subunit GatB [Chloroflexia bacterium]|nr:Asp-tRNA(Asn)/Glu-tRNA(Gln) amidotransferase subunit GatB [Chloroflexia bacterium]
MTADTQGLKPIPERCTEGWIVVALAIETGFKTVIGLEVHAQVLTQSKMYCGCSADYANAEPNTHVCPVCLGLPGALPVMNRKAIETVMRTGMALECSIPDFCKLDRKNYVYPDLPKGYQISQYDLPLCVSGAITFEVDGEPVTAGITRVHIEEDTGRLLHEESLDGSATLVDLNRSGVPLMEIVGNPDLRSPEEAREYLVALRRMLRYIGASTGNMEDGAFRCDANISIRAHDGLYIGPKVEIKNMNSFRAVERALRFEEQRQREVVTGDGELVQETRGWNDARGVTVGQRTKEQAHDYRYFPEPDLPPLTTNDATRALIRSSLPELPAARYRRFVDDIDLAEADAAVLTNERAIADIYEETLKELGSVGEHQLVANWMVNDVMALARARSLPLDQLPLSAARIAELVALVRDGKLTARAAKDILPQLGEGESVVDAATRLNLLSLDDSSQVLDAARAAVAENPAAVADYKGGKGAAIGRLIGDTMRRTGGRAKPDDVRAMVLRVLNEEA